MLIACGVNGEKQDTERGNGGKINKKPEGAL